MINGIGNQKIRLQDFLSDLLCFKGSQGNKVGNHGFIKPHTQK